MQFAVKVSRADGSRVVYGLAQINKDTWVCNRLLAESPLELRVGWIRVELELELMVGN